MLKACSHRSPTGIRNAAIIATLYRSGIRCDELVELRPKDIDRKTGQLSVLHGKGDKRRAAGIDAEAIARIDHWLEVRGKLGLTAHRPVFCTLTGGRLSTRYIRQLLPRLGERAGIHKRVHPHGLRHTHAFELAMEGVPITVIQIQLGHTNAAITSRYIQHLLPKDVLETIQARPSWDGVEAPS